MNSTKKRSNPNIAAITARLKDAYAKYDKKRLELIDELDKANSLGKTDLLKNVKTRKRIVRLVNAMDVIGGKILIPINQLRQL